MRPLSDDLAATPVPSSGKDIRVLQVMAGAKAGGAEVYFVRLALALARAGLAQAAVTRPHAARTRSLKSAGLAVAEARFGRVFDFTTRRTLASMISSFRPNVVLSFMTRATQFVPGGDFVHIARLGGYYDLKHYRRCDHLIGNTPDLVDYFMSHGWPRERVHFIPNFVDRHMATPANRTQFDTPATAPLVFALGRFHPNKAFDVLIESIAGMPDAYLWLAGEGPEQRALEAAAARRKVSGRIRFLGWQDDPAPFFAAADVLAVPSRHEPLGNVILEAWAQGVPVVAAASQGPRFLVRDGENGLLVAIDDAALLAAALSRVIADRALAKHLADGGRASLAAQFSEPAVIARYLALFAQVIR